MQKRYIWFLLLTGLLPATSQSQGVFDIRALFPGNRGVDEIWISQLAEDTNATVFLIEVDKKVPLHLHKDHTEVVYVIRGKGTVTLGQENRDVKRGDLVWIPEKTVHGVSIRSRRNMQVLSIQCPKWNPEDRFFINAEN